MIPQTVERAGRPTHDHNPTYTLALLGEFERHKQTKKKVAQDTFFILSLTHTHTGKSDKTRIIEYEMNTQTMSD